MFAILKNMPVFSVLIRLCSVPCGTREDPFIFSSSALNAVLFMIQPPYIEFLTEVKLGVLRNCYN